MFPAKSKNINSPEPFPVKVIAVGTIPVTVSLNQVIVAITSPLVRHVVEYTTVAVGELLSNATNVSYAFILFPLTVLPDSAAKESQLSIIASLIST